MRIFGVWSYRSMCGARCNDIVCFGFVRLARVHLRGSADVRYVVVVVSQLPYIPMEDAGLLRDERFLVRACFHSMDTEWLALRCQCLKFGFEDSLARCPMCGWKSISRN